MATEIEIKNLKEQFADIKTATRSNIPLIYKALDDLQIPYKKTGCQRCRQDLLNIVREELGLIESAAEESSFNSDGDVCYRYLLNTAQTWNGHLINNETDIEIVREFVKRFPRGYFDIVDCEQSSDEDSEPTEEYEGHKVVPHPDIV